MSELIISSIALGGILGLIAGWCIRSMCIARQIERISREAWKQARIIQRHDGTI